MPAIPEDLFDLVHGRDEFVFDDWQNALSLKPAFRIVGLPAVLIGQGVYPRHYGFDNQDATTAYQLVPERWVKNYAPDNLRHPWDELGRPQPSHSVSSQGQPFHKACLSLLYGMAWLQKRGHEVPADYFTRVRIVPITFTISGCDETFWEANVKGKPLQQALYDAVKLKKDEHVDELFTKGRRLCKANCDTLRLVLDKGGFTNGHAVISTGQRPLIADAVEKDLESLVGMTPATGIGSGSLR